VALHLPELARLRDRGQIILALISDLQSERAAAAQREFGFLHSTGDAIAALQGSEVDAVYCFGSAQLHYEYGMIALQAGKHLFVEKPVAPSYLQARALAETAQLHGLIAVGGHNRRFFKSLAAVRARAGVGGWRFAEAVFHKPELGKPPLYGARTWLSANGIHALDALLYMMGGLPDHVFALAGEASALQPGAFSANMRWRDGSQGVFVCNNSAGSRREEYVFHGLGETCTVTGRGLSVEVNGKAHATPMPTIGDGIAAEHEAFLQAIDAAETPVHALDSIAPSLFLAELIERGYSGAVQLPQRQEITAGLRTLSGKSILVVKPDGLKTAIGKLLPRYQLLTIQDVIESPQTRYDVVAAILGRGAEPIPPAVLAKLPSLAVVGVAGLSLLPFGAEALFESGIELLNASNAYAEAVAEYALGLAILGRRRAFQSHEAMRAGSWGTGLRTGRIESWLRRLAAGLRPAVRKLRLEAVVRRAWKHARPVLVATEAQTAIVSELKHATVGLIGWGANARAFTHRLALAHARVIVYSEHAAREDIIGAGAMPASLAEALAADIVSLHRGLTQRTRHFLKEAELARLRPGALLINIARGALIEPMALRARLARGDIFACLDTFDEEPLAASDPLRRMSNVFMSSHIAGGYPDMHTAAAEEIVGKVAAYLEGADVATIKPERLDTMS
jgi:phosphoglycerate dehydrogenase-like enzyme/predicted dehydrogenase